MRIFGIIQARLGSTRFPRKVLMPLLGKPMLQHIVERVQRAKFLMDVVVICPLQDFGEISRAVPCQTFAHRDIEEDDLVTRYFLAAYCFGADIVVRICADNPCIDPVNIDRLVRAYTAETIPAGTLMTNAGDLEGSKWPQSLGAEIYSWDLLQHMDKTLTCPEEREHPHKVFHTGKHTMEPECPYDWKSPLRFDVNTQQDFDRIENIYMHFGCNTFTTTELLEDVQREKG